MIKNEKKIYLEKIQLPLSFLKYNFQPLISIMEDDDFDYIVNSVLTPSLDEWMKQEQAREQEQSQEVPVEEKEEDIILDDETIDRFLRSSYEEIICNTEDEEKDFCTFTTPCEIDSYAVPRKW